MIDAVNKIVGTGADVYEGMIVGIVVVLAVTFSQRDGKSVQRAFFGNAVGWAAIPAVSLLAGLAFMLFFREKEWFAGWHAFVFGLATCGILAVRAVLDVKQRR